MTAGNFSGETCICIFTTFDPTPLPSSHFAPSSHSIRIMNPMTNRLLTVLPLT